MQFSARHAPPFVVLILAGGLPLSVWATAPNAADDSIRQFLAQDHTLRAYKASRRLEAANGERTGWVEAVTEYSQGDGFTYHVTAEGGSDYIRHKVLRAVL